MVATNQAQSAFGEQRLDASRRVTSPADPDKVAILDRDGTIVVDRGYLSDPAGLDFLEFAVDGLRLLHAAGYRIVVITNQSGVGRGFFALTAVDAMNARLHAMFEAIGVPLAGIYVCPHAPQDACECRKPAQQLMTRAAAELGFDPRDAVVIGDKASDVEFGLRAGARAVLIAAETPTAGKNLPHAVAQNLLQAARAVLAMDRKR